MNSFSEQWSSMSSNYSKCVFNRLARPNLLLTTALSVYSVPCLLLINMVSSNNLLEEKFCHPSSKAHDAHTPGKSEYVSLCVCGTEFQK